MAIVFAPPTLHICYMLLYVYLKFACMLNFVNILPVLYYWRGKLEPSLCACTVKDHLRIGEKLVNNSLTRDMNCNWKRDAVKLPRVALNGNSVVDDEDDGDCNSGSETHSDSASMPYQYLIERDIEREKKNSRIAEALSKKGSSNSSADAQGSVTYQDDEVFQTFNPSPFVEYNITNPQSPDGAFGQSTHAFMDENESTELEALNSMVDDEEEDEDIVPEALVNSSFYNGDFRTIDKLSSRNNFESLLMDDIEPNDDKLIHEGRVIKMTMSSSSSRSLAINGSCIINDSLKLPKVISNEIITKDQIPPALLKVLNKSSLESFKSETSVCNKAENFSPYNNKRNNESLKNGTKINIVNNSESNMKNNIVNLSEENIRITRSNVKLCGKSNISSYVSNNNPPNNTNYMDIETRMSLKKSPNQQLNLAPKNEEYDIRCRNTDSNSIPKNVGSFGIDGTLDKRVKINSQKLINDLTYGIKIVVERLDLSRIPR